MKIWVVDMQERDSYEGYGPFITVSMHMTEAGAEKVAARQRKNSFIAAITGGGFDSIDGVNPDHILGAVEDCYGRELAEELKQEIAKPGALLVRPS